MCNAIKCSSCGKATWAGCGGHIEEALAPYSDDQRCHCQIDLSAWLPSH